MTAKQIKWWANQEASEIESIEFRADFPGGISGALKIMEIGHLYYWDADEFNYRSFHSIARMLKIKIATKKCTKAYCYLVVRIA